MKPPRGGGLDDAGSNQGMAWLDFDGDGEIDLYIGNLSFVNRLYRNDGTHFIEVGKQSNGDDDGQGISVASTDYDGNGDVDLYLVNYIQVSRLSRNEGGGHPFVEVANAAGADDAGQDVSAAGAAYDGDVDLYIAKSDEPNRLFQNDSQGRFKDVARLEGSKEGEVIKLFSIRNVIGTSQEYTIILDDPDVSAKHVSIRYENENYII